MSFLFSRLVGSSATRTVETQAVKTGSSGILTKGLVGVTAVSFAAPLLSGLSSVPVVGSLFTPASQLAGSALSATQSGLSAGTGAISGIGSVLSNPLYLVAGAGVLAIILLKK